MSPISQSGDLEGSSSIGSATKAQFIHDSPVRSEVEAKLRELLVKLAADDKILGIQVCAYKDGKVIIETAGGVLGENDPRPVQNDSLFLIFSATKGIAAGMMHWLVDNGKLKLEEYVANIWPGFETNGKDLIKVHHVLNHTSGLHDAMPDALLNPLLMSNWKDCLHEIVASIPETEAGKEQLYHYSCFGWLCGGIIEHASGKKFQEVLEEAIIVPLNLEGEFYIGIPPGTSGVESRLASAAPDMEDLKRMLSLGSSSSVNMPATFRAAEVYKNCPAYANIFNSPQTRQAIVPSVNGHCSARALARYYATLASGGTVPPPATHKIKGALLKETCLTDHGRDNQIFRNPIIHDAFLGVGDYADLALSSGSYGLGFLRYKSEDGLSSFGHAGLGGSIGFCDIKHNFAMAVTVNKMTLGDVTRGVVELVCSELNVPVPHIYC